MLKNLLTQMSLQKLFNETCSKWNNKDIFVFHIQSSECHTLPFI